MCQTNIKVDIVFNKKEKVKLFNVDCYINNESSENILFYHLNSLTNIYIEYNSDVNDAIYLILGMFLDLTYTLNKLLHFLLILIIKAYSYPFQITKILL